MTARERAEQLNRNYDRVGIGEDEINLLESALLEAEKRGMERAAKIAEQHLGKSDDCSEIYCQLTEGLETMTNCACVIRDAIRAAAEKLGKENK